jgi:hypothetical protein
MNHHSDEQKNSQCPCAAKRCLEAYPALLMLESEPELKRFKETIIMNEDKTFSLMREAIYTYQDGRKELIREKDKESYESVIFLCDAYHIEPELLVSLN